MSARDKILASLRSSLEGTTRTLPLEVYLQRESDPDAAVALSLLLILVAVLVIGVARRSVSPS